MGALEDIRSLLETNLLSINNSLQLHQQIILNLQTENTQLKESIQQLIQKTNEIPSHPKSDPLKAEIINKFRRNKKLMIKNKIIETIRYTQLSVPEIKEIVVDQHNYCSKATFYRYIEELKKHDFIHINSKNIAKIKPLVEVV
jgi:DNA-binding transcriptional regulator WhiA